MESIRDTWPQIIQSTKDGSYRERYHIGDTKLLRLGSLGDIRMQIAAFDTNNIAGGGKAATTWIAKDLLVPAHRMNPYYLRSTDGCYVMGGGSVGGFVNSEMRCWLRGTVMPEIPKEIRRELKPAAKVSMSRTVQDRPIQPTTFEELWIPSYREVFGGDEVETSGVVYSELFSDAASRMKAYVGSPSATWWWLRSANKYSPSGFYYVCAGEGWNCGDAGDHHGVALGFCI